MSGPNPYASPGFVESNEPQRPEPRVGLALQRTVSVLTKVWPLILGASVLLCLPWQMLLSYVTYEWIDEEADPVGAMVTIVILSAVGQLTLLLVAQCLVSTAAWQALETKLHYRERLLPASVSTFAAVALAMFLSYIAISLAMILCLLPGIYLNIRWMYLLAVAVDQRQGGLSPLQQSWNLSGQHFQYSLLCFLIYCVPLTLVLIGSSLPGMVSESANFWVVDAFLTVIGDIATLMVCVGFVCTYHELLAAQEAGVPRATGEPQLVAATTATPPDFNG
jgi:hypothetical protein